MINKINEYRTQLHENGYLLLKDFFNQEEANDIKKWKESLENLPEEKGKWMIYFEEIDNKNMRSRVENFINYKQDIKEFINNKIRPVLEEICESEMIIFKDKINWKYSQGNGFKAHQDHPAWSDFNASRFYSTALFGNASTIENGCLQVVDAKNNLGSFNENGCIPEDIENTFDWKYLESTPNDLLIFDSFLPHRSSKNISNNSRSIFYFTFNKLSEGDYYDGYVENKRKHFPPPIERTRLINIDNNRYNLGNPLK